MLVLVLRFCAYSYGGVYNRNTAGGELQQERPEVLYITWQHHEKGYIKLL